METLKDHFFRNMGSLLTRSIRYMFRSKDIIITAATILIIVMQLIVFATGYTILAILEVYSGFPTLSKK